MKISATTYFRNAIQLDYPFIESIKSLIDWVDEYIVVVGDSTDGTREAVEALNHEKIKIVDTTWDMSLRKGGKVFAQQADIGTKNATGDWFIRLQADQVFHEKDMPIGAFHRHASRRHGRANKESKSGFSLRPFKTKNMPSPSPAQCHRKTDRLSLGRV